jgi:hypothetical protein
LALSFAWRASTIRSSSGGKVMLDLVLDLIPG